MLTKWQSTLLLALVVVVGWIFANQSSSTAEEGKFKLQTFQYKIDSRNDLNESDIDKRGSEGWELVTIDKQQNDVFHLIYKRKSN